MDETTRGEAPETPAEPRGAHRGATLARCVPVPGVVDGPAGRPWPWQSGSSRQDLRSLVRNEPIVSAVGLALVALMLAPWPSPAAESGACEGPPTSLPVEFPIDAVLFRGEVIEPAVPVDAAEGDEWALEVEVRSPVHVVSGVSRFRIVLTTRCDSLNREELVERFVATDRVEVVAYPVAEGGVLRAPASWVELHDRNATRRIETVLEYFEALLRLNRAENDRERAPILSALGEFVADPTLYEELLRAHLESRAMRKPLRRVHTALWGRAGERPDGL